MLDEQQRTDAVIFFPFHFKSSHPATALTQSAAAAAATATMSNLCEWLVNSEQQS